MKTDFNFLKKRRTIYINYIFLFNPNQYFPRRLLFFSQIEQQSKVTGQYGPFYKLANFLSSIFVYIPQQGDELMASVCDMKNRAIKCYKEGIWHVFEICIRL